MNLKLKKYIENGDYALALRLINQIIKKENTYENLTLRGIIYLYLNKFEAAAVDLEMVNQKTPGDSDLLCNLGIANKGSKNYKKAISYFQDSLVFNPVNLNSLLNLTETYIEIYEYENALTILKKINSINPNLERIYQLSAFCYREINNFSLHHENLLKANALNNTNAENYYHLGFSYIWKKDFDNALKSFNRCLDLNPNYTSAVYQINKLKNFDSKSNFFQKLLTLLDNKESNQNSAFVELTLSDIFYNEKKYDKFFLHLHRANKLKRNSIQPPIFNTELIQENYLNCLKFDLNNQNDEFTPIFILGMPRSGSSLLEQIMSQHKYIYAAGEIPLLHEQFNQIFNFKNTNIDYDKLLIIKSNYLKYLSMFPNNSFIIDKLPLNFLWIGYIKLIFPNAIFVHTLRNKIDVCMSLYRTFFADNVLEFSYSLKDINNFYNIYTNMMKFWSSRGLDIVDFNYDEFISNQKNVIQILFNKLNLDFKEDYLLIENINRPIKTASLLQINNKITNTNNPEWSNYKDEIFNLF